MSRRQRTTVAMTLVGSAILLVNLPRQDVHVGTMHDARWPHYRGVVEDRYRQLTQAFLGEELPCPVCSWSQTRELKTYPDLIALGPAIVPLVIEDLRLIAHRYYLVEVLDDILPGVDLGRLYNTEDHRWYPDTHRALWLRWWNDFGERQWANGRMCR